MIIDGEGLLLGRLCSRAAKAALLGEEVKIINCEKIIISGKKKQVFANEKERRERKGYPLKSAKFSKLPDRYVKRTVRGMLPHKKGRGQEAFDRIRCHIGVPEEIDSSKAEKIEGAEASKLPSMKYVTVEEICNWLKGMK
ncbi:50S ribosomal protein L13 [Nanoarchaeota archaeon]